MCEMGCILKETIGNQSFINKVLKNGQDVFFVSGYWGSKQLKYEFIGIILIPLTISFTLTGLS